MILLLCPVQSLAGELTSFPQGAAKKEKKNDVFKRTASEDEEKVGEEWFGWATRRLTGTQLQHEAENPCSEL